MGDEARLEEVISDFALFNLAPRRHGQVQHFTGRY